MGKGFAEHKVLIAYRVAEFVSSMRKGNVFAKINSNITKSSEYIQSDITINNTDNYNDTNVDSSPDSQSVSIDLSTFNNEKSSINNNNNNSNNDFFEFDENEMKSIKILSPIDSPGGLDNLSINNNNNNNNNNVKKQDLSLLMMSVEESLTNKILLNMSEKQKQMDIIFQEKLDVAICKIEAKTNENLTSFISNLDARMTLVENRLKVIEFQKQNN
jgi:hypothetical protein